MTKRVAILGCGPAGLLVAHAATIRKWDFTIYSRPIKSDIYGAQYFHALIPGIDCGEGAWVNYLLYGQVWQYQRKVYGNMEVGSVSPEDLMSRHMAWDMRRAYGDLWNKYKHYIAATELGPQVLKNCDRWFGNCDVVISTVPRKLWERYDDHSHLFKSIKVWAKGDSAQQIVEHRPRDNTVICSGLYSDNWYRRSNIFGQCTTEWPYTPNCPEPGAVIVEKPITHKSAAARDFIHLGRYGAWQKGILSTDVFCQALRVLEADKI